MVGWMVGWLVCWLVGWLVGWLVDYLVGVGGEEYSIEKGEFKFKKY